MALNDFTLSSDKIGAAFYEIYALRAVRRGENEALRGPWHAVACPIRQESRTVVYAPLRPRISRLISSFVCEIILA